MEKGLPEADELLDTVSDETGLTDFGDADDPGFRERLAVLLENASRQNPPVEVEAAMVEVLRWMLSTRLQLFDDHKRYKLANEKIVAPLIVVGEPRAGTTLLQSLLAQDPQSRSPRFWEVYYPSPPPRLGSEVDRRIERANADWREILDQIPKWLISHPYNDELGMGLAECERLWAIDLRSTPPTGWWRVPLLDLAQGIPQDEARQYEIHRMMLQQLQFGAEFDHWALKGTSHQTRVGALLDTYPDARILWIHRDPVVTTASFLELIAQIYEGIAGNVDRAALAARNLAAIRDRISKIMSDPVVNDPRIRHLPYHEAVADLVDTMRQAYRTFDIEFTDAYEGGLVDWLARNKVDRYGKFIYKMDALNTDLSALYSEFDPYLERFGVRAERRPKPIS